MADHIVSGDSKEAVAYALLLGIAHRQSKTYILGGVPILNTDEEWILNTYKKCLAAVENKT